MSVTPPSEPGTPASPLWAITSYFNPAGYRRRLENFRLFRQALPVPLLVVECGGEDGVLQLQPRDAERVVQCPRGAALFQKERLLNHALRFLPPHCRYVAWMDCDVILRGREWPARAVAALANNPLVQLFSTVYDLRPGLTRVDWSADLDAQSWRSRPSVTQVLADGVSIDDTMHRHTPSSSGMAWAARRELLEQHGLYDRCIIGGGDTAMACAAWGRPDLLIGRHHMNGAQARDYLAWASGLRAALPGPPDHLRDQPLAHLWHGTREDRQYQSRHVALRAHDFDPHADIAIDTDGAWIWSSPKPALHACLRDYFARRQEDRSAGEGPDDS